MTLESQIERVLAARVRAVGGLTFKIAPTTKGLPDRMVLFPGGYIYLVELKAAGGAVSPMQEVMQYRMARVGTKVHVLRGVDEVVQWVADRYAEMDEDRSNKKQDAARRKAGKTKAARRRAG